MSIIKYKTSNNLLSSLQEELNSLMYQQPDTFTRWAPHVDIKSNNDNYTVYADIPGVDPKDINVTMDGNVLTIEGERKEEKTDESSGYSCVERFTGKFYRQFTLPDNCAMDDIVAKCEKGVLKLTIPKTTKRPTKKIDVKYDK